MREVTALTPQRGDPHETQLRSPDQPGPVADATDVEPDFRDRLPAGPNPAGTVTAGSDPAGTVGAEPDPGGTVTAEPDPGGTNPAGTVTAESDPGVTVSAGSDPGGLPAVDQLRDSARAGAARCAVPLRRWQRRRPHP